MFIHLSVAALAQGSDSTMSAASKPLLSLSYVVAIGAILTMLMGMWLVFARLREKQQGFGPSSLKALGIVLFLPSVVLVAIQSPRFPGEALAALLGTVAGYVLSHSRADEG